MSLSAWPKLQYRQVDVFADKPMSGNGLAVFWDCGEMSTKIMQELTRELRQFETIFLRTTALVNQHRAKVFTMEEELDFAGHPLLGAAAVLHEKNGKRELETWRIVLNASTIEVTTRKNTHGYFAATSLPKARFLAEIEHPDQIEAIMRSIGLAIDDKHPSLPLAVVTTGLDYLLVPVVKNLQKARIVVDDMEEKLKELGAKFLYIYDVAGREGRTWDNKGLVEDIATGSAAGPVAAYLCRHGFLELGKEILIKQGRYVGRPSVMSAKVLNSNGEPGQVEVSGPVQMIATGSLD